MKTLHRHAIDNSVLNSMERAGYIATLEEVVFYLARQKVCTDVFHSLRSGRMVIYDGIDLPRSFNIVLVESVIRLSMQKNIFVASSTKVAASFALGVAHRPFPAGRSSSKEKRQTCLPRFVPPVLAINSTSPTGVFRACIARASPKWPRSACACSWARTNNRHPSSRM